MNGLRDKVAIVTAAAGGGIGKATVTRLAEEGAIVVVTDSHERRTGETVEELSHRFPGRIDGFALDVTRREDIDRIVGAVVAKRGKVDILVNNAGINVLGGVDKISIEDWTRIFDVNLTGAFHLIRAVLPSMRKQHSGAIVNVSSIAAWSMLGGSDAPYAAAKAGLLALTRAVAAEAGPEEMGREKHAGSFAPGRAHSDAPAGQARGHCGDHRLPRLRRRLVHHRRGDHCEWRPLHASLKRSRGISSCLNQRDCSAEFP
jgi:NAD(P)-dependent dehydrogenase (short-subunit alcohol dehydrogenase family)